MCVCVHLFGNLSVPRFLLFCLFCVGFVSFSFFFYVGLISWVRPNVLCRFGPMLAMEEVFFFSFTLDLFNFSRSLHNFCQYIVFYELGLVRQDEETEMDTRVASNSSSSYFY